MSTYRDVLPAYVQNRLDDYLIPAGILPLCSKADILDMRGVGEAGVRAIEHSLGEEQTLRLESESIAKKAEELFGQTSAAPVEIVGILCGPSVVRSLKGVGCVHLGDVSKVASSYLTEGQIRLLRTEGLL